MDTTTITLKNTPNHDRLSIGLHLNDFDCRTRKVQARQDEAAARLDDDDMSALYAEAMAATS